MTNTLGTFIDSCFLLRNGQVLVFATCCQQIKHNCETSETLGYSLLSQVIDILLLGYLVITHLYPYTLFVLSIYLVTLFHPIYNLLLGFSISLRGIRAIRNPNPKKIYNPSPQSFLSSVAISPSTPKCRNLQSPSAVTLSLKFSPLDPRYRHLSYNRKVPPPTIFKCRTTYKSSPSTSKSSPSDPNAAQPSKCRHLLLQDLFINSNNFQVPLPPQVLSIKCHHLLILPRVQKKYSNYSKISFF